MLSELPLRNFPESREENKNYLLRVFNDRKEGPFPGMKQVRITLLSDLHYAAALLDPYRTPRGRTNLVRPYAALRRHLAHYFQGADVDTLGRTMEDFIDEIVNRYNDVRSSWIDRNIMRVPEDSASSRSAAQAKRAMENPTMFWTDGNIRFPDDVFEKKALEELIEFACRTLSVSPTATATERTFSISGRIHTHQRSSLSPEKVEKLLFSQWNGRVIRTSFERDMFDMDKYAESQTYPVQALRNYRKLIVRTFRRGFQGRGGIVGAVAGAQAAAQAALRAASGVQRRRNEHSDTQELRSLTTSTARAHCGRRGRGRKSSTSRQQRLATNEATITNEQPVPTSSAVRQAVLPPNQAPPPNPVLLLRPVAQCNPALPATQAAQPSRQAPANQPCPAAQFNPVPLVTQAPHTSLQVPANQPRPVAQFNPVPPVTQAPHTSLQVPANQQYVTPTHPILATSRWNPNRGALSFPEQPQMVDTANMQQWVPTTTVDTLDLKARNVLSQQQARTTQQQATHTAKPSNTLYDVNPQALGLQNPMAQVMNEQMALAMFWDAVNFMRASQSNNQFAPSSAQAGLPVSAIDLNAASHYIKAEVLTTPSVAAHTDQSAVPGSQVTVPSTEKENTHSRGIIRSRYPQGHEAGSEIVSKKQQKRTEE